MSLTPRCPAAETLEGPPAFGPSVLCGVIRVDREAAPLFREADLGVLITAAHDPSTLNFCCGADLPKTDPDDALDLARANYTSCPVWQAEKKRIEAAKRSIDAPASPAEGDGQDDQTALDEYLERAA